MDCKHESFGYWPAVNESGWNCFDCGVLLPGEPNGYRPDLDRSHIAEKVSGLLFELSESNWIHVSNGTGGEILSSMVAEKCRQTGFYDQSAIVRYIMETDTSHSDYWKKIGDGVVSGNDPRDRCKCGKLATTYSDAGNSCSECYGDVFAEALSSQS